MKKLIQIFLLFSRGKQIATVVVGVHLFVLFALMSHHLMTCRWRQPRPMIVRTLSPLVHTERKVVKVETGGEKRLVTKTPLSPASPAPEKKSIQQAKKETLRARKGKPAPVQESILKEIAESFEAIGKEPKKSVHKPALSIPGKVISKTQVAEEASIGDATYEELLIVFLQNALDLPEYGEVKMEIEIDSFGKLVDCHIIEAKSNKNAKFLNEEIASLNFPVPLNFDQRHKFTIVFRNQ